MQNIVGENIIGAPKIRNNYGAIQYCDNIIGLFSIAPCKVVTLLYHLCFIYGISCLFLLLISLSKVIALPTIAIAIVLALSRSQRRQQKYRAIAITIWEAIQKRGHEPIYKTQQKGFSLVIAIAPLGVRKSDNYLRFN